MVPVTTQNHYVEDDRLSRAEADAKRAAELEAKWVNRVGTSHTVRKVESDCTQSIHRA